MKVRRKVITINYNITITNTFETLRSEPEEPLEVTPEPAVSLQPDNSPTPNSLNTSIMN